MAHPLPIAFVKRINTQLKSDADAFFHSLGEAAPVSIRINPKKVTTPLNFQQVKWSNNGYYLNIRPPFVIDPHFHAGCYYVQEASSMLLEEALRQLDLNNRKIKILDLCGAPGGKATNIISTIHSDSLLITNETIRSRADILKENIYKWGYNNVVVTQNDPAAFSRLIGFFDAIVVDAPCSGEGLFRKDPAAISQWSEQNLQLCCERQQRILHTVWPALKENGYLIYSTCTYNPEENEKNIGRFLASEEAVSVELDLEKFNEITKVDDDNLHGYYAFPFRAKGEGFFISILQKKCAETEFAGNRSKIKKQKRHGIPREAKQLINNHQDLILRGETIFSFPEPYHELTENILPMLNLVTPGLPVASVKHKQLIPEPALAMSTDINSSATQIEELKYREALEFLRKETVEAQQLNKGFNLMTYQGHGLGWVKKIDDRRSNNYFPKEWRIRMELPADIEEILKLLPLHSY